MKIKSVKRSSLYFEEYKHCLRFSVYYAGAIRDLKFENLQQDLNRVKTRLDYRMNSWSESYRASQQFRHDQALKCLTTVVTELHTFSKFKLNITYDAVYIYSNDHSGLKRLGQNLNGNLTPARLTSVKITHAPDTVVLNSEHKFRTYFRKLVLNSDERTYVRNWLMNQANTIRLSPGLTNWCNNFTEQYRLPGYFFDHSDRRLLEMFALVRPGLIKQTKTIVACP